MHLTSPRRGWSGIERKKKQEGQALVYGLFVLIGGLTALFFLFNTGQLTREKTKLVNTTDAVAYSAGVIHARTLNYEAYANRAMMANTVAIAQLISVSSWIKYADNLATYGYVAGQPKYLPFYPSYYAAMYSGPYLDQYLNGSDGTLETLSTGSDKIIRQLLMNAQQVAYVGLLPARYAVMNEVARANYLGDGTVSVDVVPLTVNEFTGFVSRYSDSDRTRFAEVSRISAKRDSFLKHRTWLAPSLWGECLFWKLDWLSRRGGTELVGFDEWKAMDTLSEFAWKPAYKADIQCLGISETPAGWGLRTAADRSTIDMDPTHYDYSLPVNPGSSGLAIATSSDWSYSGLPNFYDLSEDALSKEDPRMKFAIRLRRDKSQTMTSEGRSLVKTTPVLNDYHAQPAGGTEMAAVSASEVFFKREGSIRNNDYGIGLGKPRELGSLFNPFWQVRLIQSDADVKKAQALQGAVLP